MKRIRGQWHNVALYMLLSIALSLIGIALPFISGRFVDTLIVADDTGFLFEFGIIFTILNLSMILISFFCRYVYAKATVETTFVLCDDIIRHIHGARYSEYSRVDTAYLNNRIAKDASAIVNFTISTAASFFINGITMVITFVVIFAISYPVALMLLGFLAAYIVLYCAFRKSIFRKSLAFQEQRDHYHSKMFEQIHCSKFAKTHGLKDFMKKQLSTAFFAYKRIFFPYHGDSVLTSPSAR